jgi:hypothetical protein
MHLLIDFDCTHRRDWADFAEHMVNGGLAGSRRPFAINLPFTKDTVVAPCLGAKNRHSR